MAPDLIKEVVGEDVLHSLTTLQVEKPLVRSTQSTKTDTRKPTPETRNPKPETRDPKHETRNTKPET
jgi:hypothetical protein